MIIVQDHLRWIQHWYCKTMHIYEQFRHINGHHWSRNRPSFDDQNTWLNFSASQRTFSIAKVQPGKASYEACVNHKRQIEVLQYLPFPFEWRSYIAISSEKYQNSKVRKYEFREISEYPSIEVIFRANSLSPTGGLCSLKIITPSAPISSQTPNL